jgi:hypothetical protein
VVRSVRVCDISEQNLVATIKVRDKVILKQRKRNKFWAKLELEPYTVIERKGTKIVAENRRHTVTRNASFFKWINGDVRESDEDEYFKDRALTTEMNNEVQAPMNRDVQAPIIDILYTLDSASNYSAIQKLKPWLLTQDIPMKWEDSYVFYFLNRELKH